MSADPSPATAGGGAPDAARTTLVGLRALVADDGWCGTFQTCGQYRAALLRAFDTELRLLPSPGPTGTAGEPSAVADLYAAVAYLGDYADTVRESDLRAPIQNLAKRLRAAAADAAPADGPTDGKGLFTRPLLRPQTEAEAHTALREAEWYCEQHEGQPFCPIWLEKLRAAIHWGAAPASPAVREAADPVRLIADCMKPWLSDLWLVAHRRDLPASVQRQIERDVDQLRSVLDAAALAAEGEQGGQHGR